MPPPDARAHAANVASLPAIEQLSDHRLTVTIDDTEVLRAVCGERDGHLRLIEQQLAITVLARGHALQLQGRPSQVAVAAKVVSGLVARARSGSVVDSDSVHLEVMHQSGRRSGAPVQRYQAQKPKTAQRPHIVANPDRGLPDQDGQWLDGARQVLPRSPGQRAYMQAIADHDLTFGVGPAGCGKTWLAVACALAALQRHEVKRIILTRPAVEAGEQLGFLPGDLREKVSPYLRPLYDAIGELVDDERLQRMLERGQVEAAPLAFMRGRTLNNAFVILDEAQNCTAEQLLMLMTRLGEHTKLVIAGDPDQSDLKRGVSHGLPHALRVLQNVPGIAIVRMGVGDIMRHELVGKVLAAYAADPPPSGGHR